MVIRDWRATIAGFAGAVVVFAVLMAVVGFDRILGALARASPAGLLAVAAVAMLWIFWWGLALRTVLGVLGIHLSVRKSFLVYSGVAFSNNITPFGQAGGEPFSALLISRVSDSEYETGLAAIASVDTLNFVPSIALAIVGLGYYATTATLGDRLVVAAASVGVLAVAIVVGIALGWRYRNQVKAGIVYVFTPVVQALGRLVPNREPPERADIERRIEGFLHTIERIAADRRQLLVALTFSAAGWASQMACLWLSLLALGYPVPVAAVMVAVPLSATTAFTPLPGALGAFEGVMVAILIPVTGLGASTLLAAALIHRGATYWLPILVGGGSVSALGVSRW